MTSAHVRQAVFEDIEDLIPLFDGYRQFYGQPSDTAAARQFLQARFNHGESVLFLARDGARPVGFTQLFPSFSSVAMQRVFILNDLFVDPGHRRSGVGKCLLDAATGYARLMGAVRVSLSTDIRNTTAQATYEALGWNRDRDFFAYHFRPVTG